MGTRRQALGPDDQGEGRWRFPRRSARDGKGRGVVKVKGAGKARGDQGVMMNRVGVNTMVIQCGADASKGDGIVFFLGPPNRFGRGGAQAGKLE